LTIRRKYGILIIEGDTPQNLKGCDFMYFKYANTLVSVFGLNVQTLTTFPMHEDKEVRVSHFITQTKKNKNKIEELKWFLQDELFDFEDKTKEEERLYYTKTANGIKYKIVIDIWVD
jgi:hypothetical protein